MTLCKKRYTFIEKLAEAVRDIPRKHATLLIGIDGCGGSGKSTFSRKLAEAHADVTIVQMDDFYLPSAQILKAHPAEKPVGADFDWRSLLAQVLELLSAGREGHYQRYDWETDRLAEWHTVPVGGIVVVEGVYTIREELADKYDIIVWVDCPRVTRLARGLERDGEAVRERWEHEWMVAEDLYVERHRLHDRADLVVSAKG